LSAAFATRAGGGFQVGPATDALPDAHLKRQPNPRPRQTRAAIRVSVAQPAVSAQIRRLERELGEPLFHRDQRSVSLTRAGEALLPHARAALAAAERGRDTIASLRGVLHGRLRVGVAGPVDHRFAEALGDAPIPRSKSR
jgi:Bacterial regulatory helix-turn-helix protein, lysR family